jgi:hypothetical protein
VPACLGGCIGRNCTIGIFPSAVRAANSCCSSFKVGANWLSCWVGLLNYCALLFPIASQCEAAALLSHDYSSKLACHCEPSSSYSIIF